MRVGLLEDDDNQRELLTLWLEYEGYEVESAATAARFQQLVRKSPPDLAILDWNLPESSGAEVLSWLRTHYGLGMPVVFCTARIAHSDLVHALESGADDYLAKPLVRAEVVARLNALLRRTAHRDSQVDYQFGAYRIDPKRKQLLLEGEVLPLTQREFDLAFYLFQHQDTLVRRDQALAAVWGQSAELTTRTVDNHVSRLRRKLRTEQTHWRLTAVYQQGYRLESPGHNVTPYTHD